jgi:methyltransferase (TIGR00027 family)
MKLRNTLGSGVFWGIQIVWFPLVAVGYLLFLAKMFSVNRRSGPSQTVLASFYTRWMQHQLRTRRDVPCARIMAILPNVSRPGLRLLTAPTILAHRLTGYVPRIYRYPYPGVPPMSDQPAARTTFFDRALERRLRSIEQLVILGAGLDTRSYRLPAGTHVRCFEVDTPRTQPFKRAMLKKARITTSGVTYVPADFEKEDWYEKLVVAGFQPDRPAFFLWESVTMYLDRRAVESTLRKIAGTAPGNVVAFDYFSTEQLGDRSFFWQYARTILAFIGEPFGTFGIDSTPPVRPRVAAFVESCGLSLVEQRNFGEETPQRHAEAGFAVAVVYSDLHEGRSAAPCAISG